MPNTLTKCALTICVWEPQYGLTGTIGTTREPSLYGKTAGDLDTCRHKRHNRYSQKHNMPDLIDRRTPPSTSDYEDEGPHQKHMPHLIDSDDETYFGSPTNSERGSGKGAYRRPEDQIPQDCWDLQEKTYPELITRSAAEG
jgi:hypothetical protein